MEERTRVVSFRLSESEVRALHRLARLERRPVSEVLRRLLERETLRKRQEWSAAARDTT